MIFTDNDDALGQRMLDNVMLTSQEGARVRLFVNTVSDGEATPAPDLTASMYIEADIALESMSCRSTLMTRSRRDWLHDQQCCSSVQNKSRLIQLRRPHPSPAKAGLFLWVGSDRA